MLKRGKVLYLLVLQAICGCIESALLWYKLYTEALQKKGYNLNPYNLCVSNNMTKERNHTISWYVYDNKASQINPKVIEELLEDIRKRLDSLFSKEY